MAISSSFCLLLPYHSFNEAKGCFLEIEMLLLSCSSGRRFVVGRTGEEKSEERRAINNVALVARCCWCGGAWRRRVTIGNLFVGREFLDDTHETF